MIHFVGAGPGATDLITLRGAGLIERADCIIYAGSLVNPELLTMAKPNCKIYNSAEMNLPEVMAVMREYRGPEQLDSLGEAWRDLISEARHLAKPIRLAEEYLHYGI